MEFLSILIRNNVVKKKYIFSHGEFKDLKDGLILPYESNLIDIYEVSEKRISPNHTIPNSFRHVLETIYRFEGAVESFENYVFEVEELKSNGFVYSMIQDMSHGGIRDQKGFTDDMLIEACKGLIKYVQRKYTGQIETIKRRCN